MSTQKSAERTLGIAIVGFGGAVATTAVAGMHLLKRGSMTSAGLPLANVAVASDLVAYENLAFAGWDLCADDLATAAKTHDVLGISQYEEARELLAGLSPWPAVGNAAYSANVDGQHRVLAENHRRSNRADSGRTCGVFAANESSTTWW